MERMIDANLNRVCEGLRVIEDYIRFEKSDNFKFKQEIQNLKRIRHYIRENISNDSALILSRNSIDDLGKKLNKIESNRSNNTDLLKANFFRIEEGLRVLEESFKISGKYKKYIHFIKKSRFDIYNIEMVILKFVSARQIYGSIIISIDISEMNLKLLIKILNGIIAKKSISLELKFKFLNTDEIYKRTLILKNYCKKNNIPLIINNHPDIAYAAGLDFITVDKTNIQFEKIIDLYKKITGFIPDNSRDVEKAIKFNASFIMLNKNFLLKNRMIIAKFKDKIKIAEEVTDKFNGVFSSSMDYNIYEFIN